jgi:hypothetical protein
MGGCRRGPGDYQGETSPPNFRLKPDDLIQLKQNGVPDQVLTGMVRASARVQ